LAWRPKGETTARAQPGIEAKYLKPQNIPRLIEIGAHDCGFTGHDWVVESGLDVVTVSSLTYAKQSRGTVRWVLAVPEDSPYQSAADLLDRIVQGPILSAAELTDAGVVPPPNALRRLKVPDDDLTLF